MRKTPRPAGQGGSKQKGSHNLQPALSKNNLERKELNSYGQSDRRRSA